MAADNARRLISKIIRERHIETVMLRGVTPEWFRLPEDRQVYGFLANHYAKYGEVPTGHTVKDNFPSYRLLAVDDALEYLLDQLVAHRRAVATFEMIDNAADLMKTPQDYEAVISSVRSSLAALDAVSAQISDLNLVEYPQTRFEEYLARKDRPGGLLGLATGFPTIDKATAGLQPGQLVTIVASPKVGKATSLDTPVLTPSGWVPMGDMRVGMDVIGSDGLPTKVLAVHPQGPTRLYRVLTDDGGSVECCAEHLWQVNPPGRRPEVVSTVQLRAQIQGNPRFAYLPLHADKSVEIVPVPLHPWVIGALIGAGGTSNGTVTFAKADPHTVRGMDLLLPSEVRMVARPGRIGHFLLSTPRGQDNPLLNGVRELGLVGRSWEKTLPAGFESWSHMQRRWLLAGLLDTAGTVGDRRCVSYTTTSRALAEQAQTLVWSLGGTARVVMKQKTFRDSSGGLKNGRLSYDVILRLGHNPFFHSRKWGRYDKDGYWGKTRMPKRRIVSVEFSRVADAQCITVANEDGLYVTKDYIVTHNSQMALRVAATIHQDGFSPLFQSFEMSNIEQQERFDALRAGVSHNRLRRGMLSEREEEKYEQMLVSLVDSPPFVLADSAAGTTVSAMAAKVSEHTPDVLFVDGVYLMIDEVTGESNTPQALTNITRSFKRLAQRLKIPIVITTQALLWKMKKTQLSENSLGYSSSFLQDSDVVLGLERLEDEENLRRLKVLASRNCGPAEVDCTWDWNAGLFEEISGTQSEFDDDGDEEYAEYEGVA